jgi:predicted acetyltransferase
MELVKPSIEYKDSFIEGVKEYQALGDEKRFRSMDINIPEVEKDFGKYVEKLTNWSLGIGLKEGYVPATTLWLVENGEYIGTASIRHTLNEHLLTMGGHIGYGIRPSKRKMGYGTKILELTLPFAKKLGIDRVLVTCDDDNIASAKIIEKNGGMLENKVEHEGKLKRRYWIENK